MYHLICNNPDIKNPTTQEKAIRLLLNNYDVDLPISSLENFRGSEEAFLVLRNQIDTDYLAAPFEERVRVATCLASSPDCNGPEVLRLALQPGPILPTDSRDDSFRLLHAVAGAVGTVVRSTFLSPFPARRIKERDYVKDLPGI